MSLCFPRPGSTRAWLNYRHGLPQVRGFPLPYVIRGYYLRPRRRSRFCQGAGTLHFLAARRYMAAQCRRRNYQRIRPGLWYDAAGDVVYLQTDRIEPAPFITRGK